MAKGINELKSFQLSGNQVDDRAIPELGELIKSSPLLEGVSIGCRISDGGVIELAPYLKGNTSLKELNLQHNIGITDVSMNVFKEMTKVSRLVMIDFIGTTVGDKNGLTIVMMANKLQNGCQSFYLNSKLVVVLGYFCYISH